MPTSQLGTTRPPVGRRRLIELSAELTERHHTVLGWLATLHFATTRHIERLEFQGTGLTPLSAARLAHRCLAQLHRYGLVDHLARRVGGVRAGSASFVWRLSPAGMRLVDRPRARRRHEPGLLHLAHVLDVTELVARLCEHGRTGQLEVLGIESEPACWRRFHWDGRQRWLKPDLRVNLGIGAHSLHWFVEIDRATEDRTTLARKLAAYVAAWRDGTEQAAVGVFPGVAWIVPNPARAAVVESVIVASAEVPRGMFAVAVMDDAVETLMGNALGLG